MTKIIDLALLLMNLRIIELRMKTVNNQILKILINRKLISAKELNKDGIKVLK